MNHLETYAAAKATNVGGVQALLKLATEGQPKSVNYVSTLSIFGTCAGISRTVDEGSSIDEERHLASDGYTASKWVGEKLCLLARELGIPTNIFRLGLIWADTRRGRYDELQREYRIFKSCLLSGCAIKDYRYEFAPTPVDYAARAIAFLARKHDKGGAVFHISFARQAIAGVFERCNEIAGTAFRLLDESDWIAEVKSLHAAGRSLPVIPLLDVAFPIRPSQDVSAPVPGTNHIDCSRTHQELESAGIVAPVLDDDLLISYLNSMCSRDEQLRTVYGPHKESASERRARSRP